MYHAAIVRWVALAQREMQNYEVLQDTREWELLGISSIRPDHDLRQINFPVAQPWSVDAMIMMIPGLYNLLYRVTGFQANNLNYMFGLEKHLAGMNIVDVAETYHPFGYQVARLKDRLNYKLIVSVQENIPFTHENPIFRRRTKQFIFEKADYFFALSTMAKQTLILEGVPQDCIEVIPQMGTDTDVFKPETKSRDWLDKLGIHEDDFVILFAGRCTWSKGIFDLLWAFKSLLTDSELRTVSFKLLMVGNGDEWQTLNHMVDHLKMRDQVRLLQRVPYDQMPQIHNLADVFVLPSVPTPKWQEQFGAVLVESMGCAKPIVGTATGAIPEVIDDAGLIAHPADYTSLKSKIKQLVVDNDLREMLGKRGRQRAAEVYDSKVVGEKIRRAYERVMNRPQ